MCGITIRSSPAEAAVAAVLAGADIVLCVRVDSELCSPAMHDEVRAGLLATVADGTISGERLDESVSRVVAAKLAAGVGPASGQGLAKVTGAGHLGILAELLEAIATGRAKDWRS